MDIETKQQFDRIESMLQQILKKERTPDALRDMINIEQVAEITGLTVKTVYNYVNNGKLGIPYTKRGNKLMFDRQTVINWSNEREFKTVHIKR